MHSNETIVYALFKYFPEVAQKVQIQLNILLPDKLDDLSLLPRITQLFCEYHQVTIEDLTGVAIDRRYIKLRKELLAVLLMFYDPEKLYGISQVKTRFGIVRGMNALLNCGQSNISNTVYEVISNFKVYASFKKTVIKSYEHLKNNL